MFVFDPDLSLSPGRHFITIHTQLSWDDHPIFGTRHTNDWGTLSYSIEVPGKVTLHHGQLRSLVTYGDLSADFRSTFMTFEKFAVNII
jgi:hypothetical protein